MLAVFFLGLRDRWPVLRIRSKCSHHSSGLWRAAPDSRLRHDKGLRIIEATCDNDCERPIPVSGLIRVGSRSRSAAILWHRFGDANGSGLDAHERVVQALRRPQSARRGVR